MERNASFAVECCSWDLTGGAAANVLGKLFLRGTSSSSNNIPEAIDHVGVIVYNRLYEYGYSGIVKSSLPRTGDDPVPQYPGCKLRKREFLGNTTKPRHEFIEWLINVKYGKFRGASYDMIHHNCLDFAKAVCEFLRVPPSPNWGKVSDWAKKNQRFADAITRGFRTPRHLRENGRSASLPAGSSSSTSSENNNNNTRTTTGPGQPLIESAEPEPAPAYPSIRRRFSVSSLMNRSAKSGMRSASMETLPPSYEEALRMTMTYRRDSAPKYEDLIRE